MAGNNLGRGVISASKVDTPAVADTPSAVGIA